MNYNDVFGTIKKQYDEMFSWMQEMKTKVDVIYQNVTALNTNYKKMSKRITRIEEKANIVSNEEGE